VGSVDRVSAETRQRLGSGQWSATDEGGGQRSVGAGGGRCSVGGGVAGATGVQGHQRRAEELVPIELGGGVRPRGAPGAAARPRGAPG
jgi:hypothetical protein